MNQRRRGASARTWYMLMCWMKWWTLWCRLPAATETTAGNQNKSFRVWQLLQFWSDFLWLTFTPGLHFKFKSVPSVQGSPTMCYRARSLRRDTAGADIKIKWDENLFFFFTNPVMNDGDNDGYLDLSWCFFFNCFNSGGPHDIFSLILTILVSSCGPDQMICLARFGLWATSWWSLP